MIRHDLSKILRTAFAVAAFGVMATTGTTLAGDGGNGGLRNCVDLTGKQIDHVGCYENVWAGDVEYRMTFGKVGFKGNTPHDLAPLYVLAAQTDTPQGAPPATFAHDHVVRTVPAHNGGAYSVKLQGYFVFCSGQGLVTGTCVADWQAPGGPDLVPFAKTVDGQPLTSTDAIEAAAAAGDVVLVHLGPNAVLIASVSSIH